jgi:UDP-GlcNAc:undecaprenyl-phosphate GlcNAc-1-phosphate transferase
MLALSALLTHIGFGGAVFVLSLALTRVMERGVRIMDLPNERSSHHRPVPKSGGVAIVTAFVLGCLVIYWVADVARIEDRHFWGFLGCAVVLALVSFVDDVTQRSFLVKAFTQALCTVIVLGTGVALSALSFPIVGEMQLGWAGYAITFLWMVGLTNAYNFMDGLDGLGGGVAVIAGAFLGGIALWQNSAFVYMVSYVLVASTAGFLVLNWPPAKIFMGDVGSAFLGFAFATLAVIGAGLDRGHLSFYVVPMLLLHLIFDTAFTFFRRLGRGEKVHLPHRTHLYQLLNRTGFSHRAVSLFYCALTVAQGIGACLVVMVEPRQKALVFVPFLLFYVICAWWTVRRARVAGVI